MLRAESRRGLRLHSARDGLDDDRASHGSSRSGDVRQKYAAAARAAAEQSTSGCCSPADGTGAFGAALYGETDEAPEGAVSASLGCGVPTAVADLHDGEVVLDLGSGAGADVYRSRTRASTW